ncbi:MAG TPA: BTAD domain-containing putative transcriptional regulator [Actinomycetes bacterium]|nr:BTAD domain-containing putative transcriptional regulator [Actinomycetes bacterium]
MEIRILGPLEVSSAGRSVEVPSGKEGLLLAALAVHANHVVSTDRLFEFLWRGEPPESAANTLQTYVSHLRRILEPGRAPRTPSRLLVTRGPGYALLLEPDGIDADRFARMVERARTVLATDPAAAAAQLRTALSLWRGEPLADFTFEPFAQAEITRLGELRLAATEDRIDAELALGGHASLCAELAHLVCDNPLRERLSGQLMVALYRSGRQAEALRVYADLRRTLAEQLGVDPSPTLARLELAVLRQAPELGWPPEVAAPPVAQIPVAAAPTKPVRAAATQAEEVLAAARAALRDFRWQRAFDLFCAVDRKGGLNGEDLDGLAEAAFWLGRPREVHAARQRAHTALLAEGQPRKAAMVAIVLSVNYGARRRPSVAGGWLHRAQRLLADEPEGPEHGFLAWASAMAAIAAGDLAGALRAAQQAFDLGRRFGIPDLQALGLVHQGYVLVRQGTVADGLRLIDEGMTWAIDGQLGPTSAAVVFCRTIDTCYVLGDYRRATEWMEAIADCFARTGIRAFPGDCEAHSVAMLVGRGAWSEGEQRAREASAAVEPIDLTHVGLALAEMGEIRLRRGDLAGAEQAFARATELGSTAHSGLALTRLARGDVAGATAAIAVILADVTGDRLTRGRLLPAQVEIALAADDLATAQSAAAELSAIATKFARPALAAAAACADGSVALASGDAATAAGHLRRAIALWREAGSPYPAARARLLLGEALQRTGDPKQALAEVEAARAAFEALGAKLDLDQAVRQAASYERER